MIRLLLLALLLVIFPAQLSAQDDEHNTYTWFPAGIMFDYPAEWVTRDDLMTYGTISLSTSLEAIDATPIPEGELLIQISPLLSAHPENLRRLGMLELSPEIMLNQLQIVTNTTPERQEIDGREIYTITSITNDMAFLIVAFQYDDEMISLSYAAVAGDSLESYYSQIMDVILSIRPAELPAYHHEITELAISATDGTDGVDWVQRGELSTYASDGYRGLFGRLDTSEDQLFVATGGHNLMVFTFDGVLDHLITNDLIYFHDVVVDDDGTLWILDRINLRIWQINSEGEILTAFGSYGESMNQFRSHGAMDMALDDDYIYVLTTNSYQNYLTEDVQVWTRDGEFVEWLITIPREGGIRDSVLLYVNDTHIYVLAGGDYLHSTYDKEGNLIRHTPALLQMSYPGAFVRDEQNNLLFFETLGSVYRYDPEAGNIDLFGFSAEERTGEIPSGQLFYPRGLAVLPDGDLLVADANDTHWQVLRVTTGTGEALGEASEDGESPE